ncbi:MAG: hypothetical protein LUC93_07785, partial [Planctomycetaceae bacterium]|nr:hypothetical protein [Planctomycetaceae bacterium]
MTEEENPAASTSTGVNADAPAGDTPMAADGSGAFTHPEQSAAGTSGRRFLPPDSKPMVWYVRHRDTIRIVELALIALFLVLTLYFVYLWVFGQPKVSYEPGREGFIRAMAVYAPTRPEASWRVKATPGRWRNIVVHHTATERGDPVAIDRFHREVKKWENGLGYHFLIGNGDGLGAREVYPRRRV